MVASVYRTTAMIAGPRAFIARIVYKSGRKLVCERRPDTRASVEGSSCSWTR